MHPVPEDAYGANPTRRRTLQEAPKIELSLACRKCRRRLATHHDRCVEFFLSVICIAAIVYGFVMGPDPKLCLHNCFRTLCSNTVFWFTVFNTVFAMSAQCAVAHSVAHHKNKHLSHCFKMYYFRSVKS